MLKLALNPALDRAALSATMAREGRIHVHDVLEPASADGILSVLQAERQWALVTRIAGTHRAFDAAGMDALDPERWRQFQDIVCSHARTEFSYLYENFPLYDVWHNRSLPEHPLLPVCDFLNSREFLDLARQITGAVDITFADAQATRYRAHHFLTSHDDEAPDKNRRAAYVLSLTPRWNPDWGGQLLFFDGDGHVTGGFTPAFNALNVFMVPVRHSVSIVAPYVGGVRYSITGWLRAGADPGPG